jgi:TatD DNase family protein
MQLVDTHCHIQSAGASEGEKSTRELWGKAPQLNGDVIVANAAAVEVTKLVCVGCDLADSQLAIDFVQSRPACWAAIGIHPHEAQHYAQNQALRDEFAALAAAPKVVAIGECGLDYFYGHSPKSDQIAILKFQLELALQHNLPLIFHVREAFDDFWPVFTEYYTASRPLRAVLHSFTDSPPNLQKALAYGLFIGVNGIATFAKHEEQMEVYKTIPLQNLLLETDAPFLTPAPYRGKINESKYIGRIAEFMSQLRGESLSDLAAATTRNAQQLFDI